MEEKREPLIQQILWRISCSANGLFVCVDKIGHMPFQKETAIERERKKKTERGRDVGRNILRYVPFPGM